ncbi:hypothetical protein Tco_0971949 [Tanacetum coccineum]
MSDIDCIHHDDEEGLGGSVSGDSFPFQQSDDMRELPRLDVHTVSIRGNVSPRLSTETHDVLDITTVPLSRVFDRFRNLGLNKFDRQATENQEIQTTPAGTAGVGSYVGSPSVTAPVNHAYLCLNVTDCVIRPEIIPFSNSRLENAYQSHARGENSDTIGLMSPHNEVSASGKCSTSGTDSRTPSYIDLGNCNQQCRQCGCLFWYNERLKNNNYGRRAEYHLCCGGGKIYMPPTPDPPLFIQQLLTNSHFMKHIRAYNQMFAMTSFEAKVDNSVNMGRGPYVFKVSDEDTLNLEIIEVLIHVLDEHNGLVRLFRTSRDRCNAGEITGFKIRLYNKGGARGYEFPTSDILGGIVFEDGPKSRTDFDVIIEFRGGLP